MRKERGTYIIEYYDNVGHKVKKETESGYTKALLNVHEWEQENKGNNAVITLIMYNTILNNEKWSV